MWVEGDIFEVLPLQSRHLFCESQPGQRGPSQKKQCTCVETLQTAMPSRGVVADK